MKNILAYLIVLTLPSLSFAQKEALPHYTHLLEVNEEWKHFDQGTQLLIITSFENDTKRIQSHLSSVKDILQKRRHRHLTVTQNENRQLCLDILDEYQKEAIFPKNIYHAKRTPYFIDHLNTHCAVGQLMNKTGYGDLARKIANENNYKYVRDLILVHPEILDWADTFGFTQEELAWIQPSYLLCSDDCDQSVIAYVNTEDYVGDFTYLWSPSGDTTSYVHGCCPGSTHTVTIHDEEGTEVLPEHIEMFFQATIFSGNTVGIPENSQAQLEISLTENTGSCNGSASFELINDVIVTNIKWDGVESSSDTIQNLCTGWHTLEVQTGYTCVVNQDFFIEESVEPSLNIISISNDTLCANQCIEIEFESSGFPENSMFSFQLSDENGIFDEDNPLTIGGNTTESSGIAVSCAISAAETGTGYHLRIINFDSGISQEFDLNLTIYVVDYEVISSPGMLEVITEIPQTSYLWNNCPGNPIDGETNAQFTNGIIGNEYFVNLIQNGCPANSDCIEFEIPTGISDSPKLEFAIFPNPNNGQFNIDLSRVSAETFWIYNCLGYTVQRFSVANTTQHIDLDLASGIYNILIQLENGSTISRKLVIQ